MQLPGVADPNEKAGRQRTPATLHVQRDVLEGKVALGHTIERGIQLLDYAEEGQAYNLLFAQCVALRGFEEPGICFQCRKYFD